MNSHLTRFTESVKQAQSIEPPGGRRLWAVWMLILISGSCALIQGIAVFWEALSRDSINPFRELPLFFFSWIMLLWVLSPGRGRRKRLVKYQKKRLLEGQAPILYLRSFNDDVADRHFRLRKSNELLTVACLEGLGPVITIANPSDKDPLSYENGAIRIHVTTQSWQQHVEDMASISELVIINADISNGLEWEMSFAGAQLKSEQVLLSFLPFLKHDRAISERMYERFKRQAEARLNCTMPESLDAACFMYLDKDRRARPIKVKRWVWYSKHASILALRARFRSCLRDNLGIDLKWSTSIWRILNLFRLPALCLLATVVLIRPNVMDLVAILILCFVIPTAYSANARAKKASLVFAR